MCLVHSMSLRQILAIAGERLKLLMISSAYCSMLATSLTLVITVEESLSGAVENGNVGQDDGLTGHRAVTKRSFSAWRFPVDLGRYSEPSDLCVVESNDSRVVVVIAKGKLPPIALGDRNRRDRFSEDSSCLFADAIHELDSIGSFGMLRSDIEQEGILHGICLTVDSETLVDDVRVNVDRVVGDTWERHEDARRLIIDVEAGATMSVGLVVDVCLQHGRGQRMRSVVEDL